jgi:hypothetical protein
MGRILSLRREKRKCHQKKSKKNEPLTFVEGKIEYKGA